jgi:hypothetical protein
MDSARPSSALDYVAALRHMNPCPLGCHVEQGKRPSLLRKVIIGATQTCISQF